ncbi:MAG: hypothetical protein ACM3ML_07645 [Micromonosporaceae bacterium]
MVVSAVFGVPAPDSGDEVMAVLELRPGAEFDPQEFGAFLSAQPDLGTKWSPRFVRIAASVPMTQASKVLKRRLRSEGWECAEPGVAASAEGCTVRAALERRPGRSAGAIRCALPPALTPRPSASAGRPGTALISPGPNSHGPRRRVMSRGQIAPGRIVASVPPSTKSTDP